MKCLVLGSGRFANMGNKVVSLSRSGYGNPGRGAYVKKDLVTLSDEGKGSEGAGISSIKRKLKPLKFKM